MGIKGGEGKLTKGSNSVMQWSSFSVSPLEKQLPMYKENITSKSETFKGKGLKIFTTEVMAKWKDTLYQSK